MRAGLASHGLRCTALLMTLVALGCGPSVGAPRLGKEREVRKTVKAFNAHDSVYAVARLGSVPENGKVMGRLAIVEVPGRPPGVLPGFDTTMDLLPGMDEASFTFTAPIPGWPDGKYRVEIVILDASGKPTTRKSAEFTTTGHEAPPKGPAR